MTTNNLTTEAETKELVISRVFKAPRELVFKAFSESEALDQWWGPVGMEMCGSKLDFRPGGMYHYGMKTPDGKMMWGRFKFLEIIKPERIVFINSFADKEGNIIRAPFFSDFPLEVKNIITFTEHDGKTTLTLRGGPINATEKEQKVFYNMQSGMQQGFSGTFDQLEKYISKLIAKNKSMETKNNVKERKVTITRIFNAPRKMVFKAWTDPKQMEQWWGPHGFTSSDCKMDVKPNGKWQIRMDAPQMGFNNLWTKGIFKEIIEPKKLVLTTNGSAGNEEAGLEALATVTFEEQNGKTKLTLHVVVTKLAPSWEGAFAGMEQGWSQSLEKLTTLLTKN